LRATLGARAAPPADVGSGRLRDALAQLGEVVEACEMEQYRACRDDLDGHPVLLPDTLRDRVAHALAVTHAALPDVGRSAVLRADDAPPGGGGGSGGGDSAGASRAIAEGVGERGPPRHGDSR